MTGVLIRDAVFTADKRKTVPRFPSSFILHPSPSSFRLQKVDVSDNQFPFLVWSAYDFFGVNSLAASARPVHLDFVSNETTPLKHGFVAD